MSSLLTPSFLQRLADPAIKTVFLVGCGGGFDFLHGALLWPELQRLGKRVVMGSYSFGDPRRIHDAPVEFEEGEACVKRVSASSVGQSYYAPEVHSASFLDAAYPTNAPHWMYAYYARAFTVPTLRRFYQHVVDQHSVDAVVLFDGGSDSLMAGDEEGLGDPLEDQVSLTAVADLIGPRLRMLLVVGVGADRFNHVSDAATLRAVAELTAAGGFWGSIGIEPDAPAASFYARLLAHLNQNQTFRSVLSECILAANAGAFGAQVPESLQSRVRPGELFLWPLMSTLFAFDVHKVVARSRFPAWIRHQTSVPECYLAIVAGRASIEVRPVENLPRHEEARNQRGRFF